ncbi:hypothetical protein FACS1894159_03860 [Bacteroidia bacterium]|nr:hypothetical protein FACS1894159_03860 [Bacteroidia bacterium]
MSKFVDYARLRTIDDVRAERNRINRRIDRVRENLDEDLQQFTGLFTIDYWLEALGQKLLTFNSTVKSAWSGVKLIMSLFGR